MTRSVLKAWLAVCALALPGVAPAGTLQEEVSAAEAAELFHHEVMTKGFVRAKGWDLAGGRITPEFDSPEFVDMAFDELSDSLRGAIRMARGPQVDALPNSVGDVSCSALLLSELRHFHQRNVVLEAMVIAGSQVVYSDVVDGAVEMIVAAPSPEEPTEPADAEAILKRWRAADHSARFEAAAALFEMGSDAEQEKALGWIIQLLALQASEAAVTPLRGASESGVPLQRWPQRSPFAAGLDAVLESGAGLAVLGTFPGHPAGIRSAAVGFRAMGLERLASRYEQAIPVPALPVSEAIQERQRAEVAALGRVRAMGSPSVFLSAVLAHGGEVRLSAGSRPPMNEEKWLGPALGLASALDEFGGLPEYYGSAERAFDIARQLTLWEAPAMAWSFLSASIQARSEISLSDLILIHTLQRALDAPALTEAAKAELATKLNGSVPEPLASVEAHVR